MDYSHIADPIQFTQPHDHPDELDDIHLDSELLLSKIEFQEHPIESPEINYNAVEAKIKELTKTADPPPLKKSKPYCGCGQYYSCTSSLYLHIRSKHKGQPPPGTIGGPKGIVKKPYIQQEEPTVKFQDNEVNKYIYPPPLKRNEQSSLAGLTLDQVVNEQRQDLRRRGEQTQGVKSCKICGKTYSCNSSLNLHLKRKHQMRRREDGTVQIQSKPEDKLPRNYECTICGLSYGSKSALGLHYNNKHNSRNGTQQLPYDDERVQKCGCGLIYQSRSALNMHVKKKHGGLYPEGTSEKPNLRVKGRNSENYVIEESEDDHPSIYDSDSEGKSSKPRREQKIVQQPQVYVEKIYKCGCGRTYSCSSSLNLHIKKNHNWVVPKGTIGGPRGMRSEEERFVNAQRPRQGSTTPSAKDQPRCSQCRVTLRGSSYFCCETCQSHMLCSGCFWKGNNFDDQNHSWNIMGKGQ